eukprot:2082765-Amphidinium_carterae.1
MAPVLCPRIFRGCEGLQDGRQDVMGQPRLSWHAEVLQSPVILDFLVVASGEQRSSSCTP